VLLDGRIYAEVQLNGAGPYRFVVDTGGGGEDALTEDTAAALGLPGSASYSVSGVGEKTSQAYDSHVDTLELAGRSLHDLPVMVVPAPALRTPTGVSDVAGLIGYGTLQHFAVTIDYSARTLTLSDAPPPAPAGRVVVPFTLVDEVPTVSGALDGIPATFLVDTGDRSALTLFTPFVGASGLGARFPDAASGITGWGVGGPVRARLVRPGTLVLGEPAAAPDGAVSIAAPLTRLSEQKAGMFASTEASGSIGFAVLHGFRLTVDYPGHVLELDPQPSEVSDATDRGGLWLNADEGGVRVAAVWSDGAAQRAGVREGDLLVAVEGQPTAGEEPAQVRECFQRPAGTAVHVTVARGAVTHDLVLLLADPA
jgi:hypothetical protein